MSQLQEIFNGWYNWINQENLSQAQKDIAEKRLLSCSNCQYKKERWLKKIIDRVMDITTGKLKPVREKKFSGYKCSICSCPLDKKILSWSTRCPLPYYNNSSYPHPQRWGEVYFEDGVLKSEEAIYHTEPN
jgi:hypothetical protein